MPSRLWVQRGVVPACLGPAMGRGTCVKAPDPLVDAWPPPQVQQK